MVAAYLFILEMGHGREVINTHKTRKYYFHPLLNQGPEMMPFKVLFLSSSPTGKDGGQVTPDSLPTSLATPRKRGQLSPTALAKMSYMDFQLA